MDDFGFQWHLSDRCNLRCRHCYQDRFDAEGDPPLATLRAMADRIVAGLPGGCPISINLTGGEPLLDPRLPGLVEHLEGLPSVAEVAIITNATLAPAVTLERLAACPSFQRWKVSLESGDPTVNDAIRGRGNLKRVATGVRRLRRATGRPVVLMVTLGRHNVASVPATVALGRELGAVGIIFERFVPLGSGGGMAAQVLDAPGWRRATRAVAAAAGLDVSPLELLAYRAFWLRLDLDSDDPLAGALCNLGVGSMALMPDGTVHPCRRLPVQVGNVLREPFGELRARLAGYAPGAMRPRMHGPTCGGCGVQGCAGCRALARALTDDLLADDPQCTGEPDQDPLRER